MMLPQEIIGQKVWLEVERDDPYGPTVPVKVQAEISQPTSPPWFYARFENAPRWLRQSGQWLTQYEAEMAVLLNPVLEDLDYEEDDLDDLYEDEINSR